MTTALATGADFFAPSGLPPAITLLDLVTELSATGASDHEVVAAVIAGGEASIPKAFAFATV